MKWWCFPFPRASLGSGNGCGHQVPMQHFPHHLHCYELFVCGVLRRAEMETLLRLPEGCVNLSLSLSPSFSICLTFVCTCECVCVSVCVCVCVYFRACVCEELWQTKLDSVGGVNSITIFFSLPAAHFWIWFSPSSKANQIDTYWKRRFLHDWIFTWAALTGMAVNL